MPTNMAKDQKKTALARLYCGHVIEFKAIYIPQPEALVWCYKCDEYSTVHDHPLNPCTSQPTRVG